MDKTNKPATINPNGLAIVETLINADTALTFAEIAALANIEPKTGYLTAAKKIAAQKGYTLTKIANGATLKVKTITTFPNGLTVEKEAEKTADAYTLVAIDKAE